MRRLTLEEARALALANNKSLELARLNVAEKAVPKSTLSQHFKALREAGLIRSERRGVEMLNTSRCSEIEQRFPGLVAAIINAYRVQLQPKPRKRQTQAPPRRAGV